MSDLDETNEDDNAEFELPTTWRLLLGFLPLDIEAFIEFLRSIREEGRETSWNRLYRRAASFGISVATIGGIVVGLIFLIEGVDMADVPINFTLPYIVIGAIVVVVLVVHGFIKLMQGINDARSPVAEGLREEYAMVLELIFGIALFGIFGIFTLQSFSPLDMIIIAALGGGLMGLLIAGTALILSALTRARNLIRGTDNPPNASLDDFDKGKG